MSLLGGAYAGSSSSDDDEGTPVAAKASGPLVAYGGESDSEEEAPARGVKRPRADASEAVSVESSDGVEAATVEEEEAAEGAAEMPRDGKRAKAADAGAVDEDFWRRPVPEARPVSECSPSVRARIAKFQEMRGKGIMLNAERRNSKAFRNPSILTQLVESIGLDAQGSNLAPTVYDPSAVPKGEFYDALLRR